MPLLNQHPDIRDNLRDKNDKEIFTCTYLHDLTCFK